MAEYKPRIADSILEEKLDTMGAVLIEGATIQTYQEKARLHAGWRGGELWLIGVWGEIIARRFSLSCCPGG